MMQFPAAEDGVGSGSQAESGGDGRNLAKSRQKSGGLQAESDGTRKTEREDGTRKTERGRRNEEEGTRTMTTMTVSVTATMTTMTATATAITTAATTATIPATTSATTTAATTAVLMAVQQHSRRCHRRRDFPFFNVSCQRRIEEGCCRVLSGGGVGKRTQCW